MEGAADGPAAAGGAGLAGVLIQIALIDIIFSLDSVITAVGLAQHLTIMILAIVISVGACPGDTGAPADAQKIRARKDPPAGAAARG